MKKVLVDIYCADGSTKESILVDSLLTVGGALKLMAEKSCVDCHVKWGLVERLPELFIDRCLEDDEKLLRVISTWKPQTPNRLIFAQRLEKYDLFRRPERYLLDPYDKATNEAVMESPWDATSRQSLVQRVIDSVNQASTTLLEGPLYLKTEGKKWKKFHFILRDYNLFQTTKSKKGSVHDVHFVASLATVKVYNGIGWKKRYKAPTDFCFALKPPEVQEKKAHIRYLCADNEFIKWGWYSMLRLMLGPPQQLVDNYNNQLGIVTPLPQQQQPLISRSASITSNGDCSMSSGCVSEVDEENAFDVDYPDGGTIRRKPASNTVAIQDNLPLPPPPPEVSSGELTPTGHLPLPPPPTEEPIESGPIREELYPCGVMRTRYHPNDVATDISQISLLQQLPTQPPPNIHALMQQEQQAARPTQPRRSPSSTRRNKKITFSEYVHDIENSQWEQLKGKEPERAENEESYKEQDVSNWVLDSLRHCGSNNGQQRRVPNCFSPEEIEAMQMNRANEAMQMNRANEAMQMNRANSAKYPQQQPPPPPTRSDGTYLSP